MLPRSGPAGIRRVVAVVAAGVLCSGAGVGAPGPASPSQLTTDYQRCATGESRVYVASNQPTLRSRVPRATRSIGYLVERWDNAGGGWVTADGAGGRQQTTAGGATQWTIPVALAEGQRYRWQATSSDGMAVSPSTEFCEFVVDTVAPPLPKAVTSVDYPDDGEFHGAMGQAGRFTIVPPESGAEDIASYLVVINDDQPGKGTAVVPAADRTAVATIAPTRPGTNTLRVWARDRAGNLAAGGQPVRYPFQARSATPEVAHWAMGGSGGRVASDRVGGRTAELGGDANLGGDVLAVDGATGHASTAGPVVRPDRSFSVSAWVRLPARPAHPATAVSQNGQHEHAYRLAYSPVANRWVFEVAGADSAAAPRAGAYSWQTPQPGSWTHLTGVYDAAAGQVRLYVNGILGGSAAGPGGFPASGSFEIGRVRKAGRWADHWLGELDDVRVWDRAVLPAEVPSIATAGDGLALRWDLNDDPGSVVADLSGDGRTGRLTGGASWAPGNDAHFDPADRAVHLPGPGGAGPAGERPAGSGVDAAGPAVRTDRSFTVSASVRLSETSGRPQVAVSQDGTATSGFSLGYGASNKWEFAVAVADRTEPETVRASAGYPLPVPGQWTNLAGVYDAAAGEISLYVNGTRAGTTPVEPLWNAAGPLHAGRKTSDGQPSEVLNGEVDDVRVYSGALGEDDILRIDAGS